MPEFNLIHGSAGATGCHLCWQSPGGAGVDAEGFAHEMPTFVAVKDPAFRQQSTVSYDGPFNTMGDTPTGKVVEDSIRPSAGPALASALPGHEPARGDEIVDMVSEAWAQFRRRWYIDAQLICATCATRIGEMVGLGDATEAKAAQDEAERQLGDAEARLAELETEREQILQAAAAAYDDRVLLEAKIATLERGNGHSTTPPARPAKPKATARGRA
jgi:hypothetical protein